VYTNLFFSSFFGPTGPPILPDLLRWWALEDHSYDCAPTASNSEGYMHYTLAQIAELVGGQVHGDAEAVITGVASLEAAGEGDISFAQDKRYFDKARKSNATALSASVSSFTAAR